MSVEVDIQLDRSSFEKEVNRRIQLRSAAFGNLCHAMPSHPLYTPVFQNKSSQLPLHYFIFKVTQRQRALKDLQKDICQKQKTLT